MKKQKIFMTIGAISAIGSPIVAVVACGTSEKEAKTLQIGIRPETKALFEQVKNVWEKANPGYKIAFSEITNDIGINGSLDLWKAAGSVPDVMVMDTSWANFYAKKGLFQSMDLKDIATNPKYKINNELIDQKYKETDITAENFASEFSTMINDSKTAENEWSHFATGIGPQVAYMWKKGTTKDGAIVDNLFDGTKNLDWYVPNNKQGDQINIDKVDFGGTSSADSPLFKPGTSVRYKNTLQDIQAFIANAARKDQAKFNGDLNPADSKNLVMSTGYYGQTQRFVSILLTLKNEFNLTQIPMDGEFWLSFMGMLQGKQTTGKTFSTSTKTNASDVGALDDSKVFVETGDRGTNNYKINLNDKPENENELSLLEKQMWYGQLGYYQDGVVKLPRAIDSKYTGQGDGIAAGNSLGISSGGGWMYTWKFGYSRPEAELPQGTKKFGLDAVQAIPLPFEFAGTEGFALKAGLNAAKDDLAKGFIRFLMQKEIQLILNGISTMATRKSALEAQKPNYPAGLRSITESGNLIPAIAADKTFTTYMDTIYNIGKKSTQNIYEQYNESFYKNVAWSSKDLLANPESDFDIQSYMEIIGKAIDNYKERKNQG